MNDPIQTPPIPDFTFDEWEAYEERAAIMEIDGGLTREEAEREARDIIIKARKIVAQPERKIRWTASELVQLDTTAPAQLWDGFLPTSEIVLFVGVQGKGKSTLVRELCLAITRDNETFLTRKLNTRYRRVIYVKGEGGIVHMARILKRYGGVMPEGFIVIDAGRLSLAQVIEEIQRELKKGPVDAIVLDSLGNFFIADQNSNSDAQNFLRKFTPFAEEAVLLFIHHIGKAGHHEIPDIKFVQGAGAFTQRARGVIIMVGNDADNRRWLRLAKEDNISDEFKKELLCVTLGADKRYHSDGSRWPIEQIAEVLRPVRAEDGESVQVQKEQARMMREAGASIQEIATRLNKSKSTIHDWTKNVIPSDVSISKKDTTSEADNESTVVRSDKPQGKRPNERRKKLPLKRKTAGRDQPSGPDGQEI